ncbi:MAG: hypothetical protein GX489_10340, partial [Firmicutes bacterium]|nr:hypothetical protein [Bacillota bacterium]
LFIYYLWQFPYCWLQLSASTRDGRKIKSAADFATGGQSARAVLVAATIMGTLVN